MKIAQTVDEMKIIEADPPMFARITEIFKQAVKPGVMFCWGDTIYYPKPVAKITEWLRAHEFIHNVQQNGDPVAWWEKYLISPQFRIEQEIPAHRAEYRVFCLFNPDRRMRRFGLHQIASRLAGPLYNHSIKFDEAKRIIKDAGVVREPARA